MNKYEWWPGDDQDWIDRCQEMVKREKEAYALGKRDDGLYFWPGKRCKLSVTIDLDCYLTQIFFYKRQRMLNKNKRV